MNDRAAKTPSYPPEIVDKYMTLKAYDADRLDQLALRVLDLCGRVREMARLSRDEKLENLHLHDRKTLEHLDAIEQWLYKAEAELHGAAARQRGQQAAQKKRRVRAR